MITRFIIKLVLQLAIVAVISYLIVWKYAYGYIDVFYPKVTHSKTNALIIGSSRAMYGINPDSVFKHTGYSGNALNFAFTSANSPYGEVYFKAIKKVIDSSGTSGIFIVEVGPLALCSKKDSISGEVVHPEQKLTLSDQYLFSMDPNAEYIFKHYKKPLYKLILNNNKPDPDRVPHSNGWVEQKMKFDTLKFKKEGEKNYAVYRRSYVKYAPDTYRSGSLEEIVNWLGRFGKVVLVRLPVNPDVRRLENMNVPDFDKRMYRLAHVSGGEYFTYEQPAGSIYTYDGGHLHPYAANEVSSVLHERIFNNKSEPLKVLLQQDYE